MAKFYIGKNLIEIWESSKTLRTTFPDGTKLVASPQDNDEYRKTARDLGYGEDTWRMCKRHEILHTIIAVSKGLEYSRGLYRAAKGLPPDEADYIEEGIVIEIQKITK